jgi:hypothetical protein
VFRARASVKSEHHGLKVFFFIGLLNYLSNILMYRISATSTILSNGCERACMRFFILVRNDILLIVNGDS